MRFHGAFFLGLPGGFRGLSCKSVVLSACMDFHGAFSMHERSWCSQHGWTSWRFHGAFSWIPIVRSFMVAYAFPCYSIGVFMVFIMVLPHIGFHGGMMVPWCSHGLPWGFHRGVCSSWRLHGAFMVPSWWCIRSHGASSLFRGIFIFSHSVCP